MTDWRAVKPFAVASDDCTRCGFASWHVDPRPGHWLCGHGQVKRDIGRDIIAIGVAREVCDGRFHTKAKGAA